MATLVFVGSSQTRILERGDVAKPGWVYTRRSVPIEAVEP
jgi:precorrin-3B methylase